MAREADEPLPTPLGTELLVAFPVQRGSGTVRTKKAITGFQLWLLFFSPAVASELGVCVCMSKKSFFHIVAGAALRQLEPAFLKDFYPRL